MATRFVRVDLSDTARDYQPIAVEPGVAMLDRAGANNRILFRWLGGLAAEPVWEEESVSFYVRDDHGGRLEDVICQPATEQDLKTILKDDLAKLKSRIDKATAETPTERTLRKILVRSFQAIVDSPARTDHDSYFFRYRDVQGTWRLVWCWGYQRLDQEPAPSVVCTDPECNLLFVRRPGKSPKCPSCEATLTYRKVRRTNWKAAAIAALLLLLLCGGIGWWMLRPAGLIATPQTYSGQVGTRVEIKVLQTSMFKEKDVTRDAVGIVYDPRVARFNPATGTATLLAPGTTLVHFQVGDKKTDVALSVGAATVPEKLLIEPATVELGVGTTARLKAIGEFQGGNRVDLTDAVQWKPLNDNTVYAAGGLVEGLAQGSSIITASYRPSPEVSPIEASANVSVAKLNVKSLEVEIDPANVGIGRTSGLRLDAVTEDGKKYSVLESSQLKAEISPPSLARLLPRSVRGDRQGHGKLAASFGPSNAIGEKEFDVGPRPPVDFLVRPENLEMAVGEITDVNVMSPTPGPIRMTSSKPDVVQITAENRLVARAVGDAEVTVAQGGRSGKVNVTVTRQEFDSMAIDPASLAVAVDDTLRPRVVAQTTGEGARPVELAPEFLVYDKEPSPRYAELNKRGLELRGVLPTDPSIPQTLAMHFRNHRASAPVEVYIAPCRLELTPPGPIDLPVGQLVRLQGWAHYSGDRRVLVPSERLTWQSEQKSVPGIQLFDPPKGAVGALKAGAGPFSVFANYYKTESNHVVLKSVEADPSVKLAIDVDRTLRLAGEPGEAVLTATSAAGDVELVPGLADFKTSDDKVLTIAAKTGAFRAATPGEATISATHLAAKDPASLRLLVCDTAKATLVLKPNDVKLNVNEQAIIKLFLNPNDGKTEPQELKGPGVGYSLSNPDAVRWSAPLLTGLSAAQLTLSAGHTHLNRPATAKIEVVGPNPAQELRITPSALSLAPGQSALLVVEQQVDGEWKEVRPDSVAWIVPPALDWSPATAELHPAVTVPAGISGEFPLLAKVGDLSAKATVSTKAEGPDAKDPAAVLRGEPAARYLAVGHQHRYTIMVDKGDSSEPAADVRWPANFENEFAKWEAPVLTAKKPGYTQWLRADVNGRGVLLHTTFYVPGDLPPVESTAERAKLDELIKVHGDIKYIKIVGDDGQSVRFPVGATFKFPDFYVEVKFEDGFSMVANKKGKATLRTSDPPQESCVATVSGALVGMHPGKTVVTAEYGGKKSTDYPYPPLNVEVTEGVDVDEIAIDPAPITMRPGETFGLRAIGRKGGKSAGDITGLGNVTWQADSDAVRLNGPSVNGVRLGSANVTAKFGSVTSKPARVDVVDSIDAELTFEPKAIRMHVGESLPIGPEIKLFRGKLEVSQQVNVTSETPGTVRYAPESRSLIGVAPGSGIVDFGLGDKVARVEVTVLPAAAVNPGTDRVVIEPPAIALAPGQLERVRVLVITGSGERIDRSSSAVLVSTDPKVAAVHGDQVRALAPGKATIKATFSGFAGPASTYPEASVTVHDETIDDLMVEPNNVQMSVRDRVFLHILGLGKKAGWHELYPQAELKTTAGGPNPAAVQIVGSHEVNAVTVGKATADISFRDRLKTQAQIEVTNNPIANLQISPGQTTVAAGDAVPYQVTVMRGGERRVLGPQDGVTIQVDNSAVAQVLDGFTVGTKAPGRAIVVARLGDQKAEASLDVAPRGTAVATVDPVPTYDPREVVRRADGVVVAGPDVTRVAPDGRIVYADPAVVGERVVVPGTGTVVGPGVVTGSDVVPGTAPLVQAAPAAVKGLRFRPDLLRMGATDQPALVRVYEVREDDTDGRDVTADPNLSLSIAGTADVAELQKTTEGQAAKPLKEGKCRVTGTLGTLTTADPLWIEVGAAVAGAGRLVVTPNPVTLWSGQTAKLASVTLEPGGDRQSFPVPYKVDVPAGQGIVSVDAEGNLKAVSNGTIQATVAATDPQYQGLSAPITIQVTSPERMSIVPAEMNLRVGEKTGPIRVTSQAADGTTVDLGAEVTVESADPSILDKAQDAAGQFVAKGQGQTKLRATYRGMEVAPATVSITDVTQGQRFQDVRTALANRSKDGFDVSIDVLAAGTEGELEYRVYAADQTPAENWVPNQAEGDSRKVVLRSAQLPYKAAGEMYQLVVEARDKAGKSQKYPLTFQLEAVIKRTESGPVPPGNTVTPR